MSRERPAAAPPLPPALATRLADARWHRDLVGEAGAAVHRAVLADGTVAYLKHGTGTVADDVADEAARLRWLAGRLPVPRVLAVHLAGDAAWLLTEALPGPTAYQRLSAAGIAEREGVVDALAAALLAHHALPAAACPFNAAAPLRMAHARARLEQGLIDAADFDAERAGWSPAELWAALAAALPPPVPPVVTHGDFSLDNLLMAEAGRVTGIIDVGRAGLADPYQDVAILWNCLREFDDGLAGRLLARVCGPAGPDRARLRFHLLLDECF